MEPTARAAIGLLVVCVIFTWAYAAWADELQRPKAGEKVKVFILAGQSNMEGRADGNKLAAQDRERLEKVQVSTVIRHNAKNSFARNTGNPALGYGIFIGHPPIPSSRSSRSRMALGTYVAALSTGMAKITPRPGRSKFPAR